MITVSLKVPPELQSKPRRFRHRARIHSDKPRSFATEGRRPEAIWQRKQMGTIVASIETFNELLCEGIVSVEVQGGHSVVKGSVTAFTEESLILAEEIGGDIEAAAYSLASKFPKCKFSTTVCLECRIIEVFSD